MTDMFVLGTVHWCWFVEIDCSLLLSVVSDLIRRVVSVASESLYDAKSLGRVLWNNISLRSVHFLVVEVSLVVRLHGLGVDYSKPAWQLVTYIAYSFRG